MRFVLASSVSSFPVLSRPSHPVLVPSVASLLHVRAIRAARRSVAANFHRTREAAGAAHGDACGCVTAVRRWEHPGCFSGISSRSRGWQWGCPGDSRARGWSISRRRVGVATTRGSAARDTAPAPSPSTETPAVGSAAAAAPAAAAVAVARTARSPAENRNGPASRPGLSWFTSELGAFAVGRHASVEDELMLRRKNPTTAKNATEP